MKFTFNGLLDDELSRKVLERRRWEEGQLELKKGDERIVPSENEKPDVER